MNPAQRDAWQRDALDMAFRALAESEQLSTHLVYKGARILALRLGSTHRASYDLDANLQLKFAATYPERADQIAHLETWIRDALARYLETSSPVRYELTSIKVVHRPRDAHPLGWNAFDVSIELLDRAQKGVRGLPRITFDIAAPESLGEDAIAPLRVGDREVFAYTLERIAGEKLRAFLSTLPAYRAKVAKPGEAVRAKDLYDIAQIQMKYPMADTRFWRVAGDEFVLACRSRFIDCEGLQTFAEDIRVTQSTYESDPVIPKDISFDAAWCCVQGIVQAWTAVGMFPLSHPLPQ